MAAMSYELFKGYVDKIEKVWRSIDNINRVLSENTEDSFLLPFTCQDEAAELLEYIMGDKDGWISYYCFEKNFGREDLGPVTVDGEEYPLRTVKDLYRLLTRSDSLKEDNAS